MISPPVGHPTTPRTSPMQVYQLLLHLLRVTFTEIAKDSNYPFRFTDDPETTGIFIASVLDKNTNMYGAKPIILVSRGAMSNQPIVTGDRSYASLMELKRNGTSMVQSSVDITVLSKRATTTDIIATEVFGFLTSCRSILPPLLGIHQILGAEASPVQPFEDDDHMFAVQLNFNYIMQYKWDWEITPTLLGQIGLFINGDLTISLDDLTLGLTE